VVARTGLKRDVRASVDDGSVREQTSGIPEDASEYRRVAEQAERSARYEAAVAECAQALLASSGENRIQDALESLFVATEATYVFLERNVIDPDLGFCTQSIADAGQSVDGSGAWKEHWDLVPWDKMPTSRRHLEEGLPFVVVPGDLEGPEFDQYASDPYPILTELDIPVFVGGEWAGLIGFADQTVARQWTDSDVSLLTTVAKMIGAFWEREAHQEHLVEVNRAKDAFLASVSHELRTPLTTVVGFAQILKDSADTLSVEERDELLDLLVMESADLTNIINDLLVAARADISALEATSVQVDLRAQVSYVLGPLGLEDIERVSLSGEAVQAIGDPERIRQIVRNLVSNALRYGGEVIRVDVCCDAVNAQLRVCDSGTAIPEQDSERIFEPYHRAHNAPGLAGSLGLGLAISRQLAQLMGGELTYRRTDGENTFELTLPVSS